MKSNVDNYGRYNNMRGIFRIRGRAAFTYKRRMVALPVVDQARQVLARHAAITARERKA